MHNHEKRLEENLILKGFQTVKKKHYSQEKVCFDMIFLNEDFNDGSSFFYLDNNKLEFL